MRGRIYDSTVGRFLTPDPFVQSPYWGQGYNRYSYVFNNPTNLVDPSGFDSECDGCGIVIEVQGPPRPPGGGISDRAGSGDIVGLIVDGLKSLFGGSSSKPQAPRPKAAPPAAPKVKERANASSTTPTATGSDISEDEADHSLELGILFPPSPNRQPDLTQGGTVNGAVGQSVSSTIGNPWAKAAVAVGVLAGDDATGLGVADNVAIPVILAAALAYELTQRTYITYTLRNPAGQVYVGRASGFGSPEDVLAQRLSTHHMVMQGFGNAQIDVAVQGDSAYSAIRGREQQLVDSYGGVGSPGVANAIRGVSKWNPVGRFYHTTSDYWFGNIAPYTGGF